MRICEKLVEAAKMHTIHELCTNTYIYIYIYNIQRKVLIYMEEAIFYLEAVSLMAFKMLCNSGV